MLKLNDNISKNEPIYYKLFKVIFLPFSAPLNTALLDVSEATASQWLNYWTCTGRPCKRMLFLLSLVISSTSAFISPTLWSTSESLPLKYFNICTRCFRLFRQSKYFPCHNISRPYSFNKKKFKEEKKFHKITWL